MCNQLLRELYFFQVSHHRKHDGDILFLAGTKNSAQLIKEDLRLIQHDTNTAPAKERIILLHCLRHELVTANIECADNGIFWIY